MLGKKYTPKAKAKAKRRPKRKSRAPTQKKNEFTFLLNLIHKKGNDVRNLEKRIDLLQQQVVKLVEWSDKIAKMLHYNQIFPEPENKYRWFPAISTHNTVRHSIRNEKKPDKEPEEWYTTQPRPENYTTNNTMPPERKKTL